MWAGIAEKVFKVRGQRSRSQQNKCTNAAEAYIRVPTHPWKSLKVLEFFLLNSKPWKYLKTGQVLESPWISFHRSLKVQVKLLDRWLYFAGKLSWDITTTQVNSGLHPSGVAKSSTSFGWGKGGKVTSVGWQVTLCDLIWHVISRSGVVISITNCYIWFTLLYFMRYQQLH